tara:strand:+ start:1 stop:804 length:804 start_codon:yes stop_codon:yes gene_type:complete
MGPDTGVNKITPDMLALGALRHNQIPCLIGKEGEVKESLEGGFSIETTNKFISDTSPSTEGFTVVTSNPTPTAPLNWQPLYTRTFNQPIVADGDGRMDAHALILLGNAHVNRLVRGDDQQITDAAFKAAMRERRLAIGFRFTVEVESLNKNGVSVGSSWVEYPNTARAISPGFTIDYNSGTATASGYPMLESATYDYLTFKDCALRAVVLIDPVPAAFETVFTQRYKAVRMEACVFGDGSPVVKARIDKINLTAIPIHTKVEKHGGS